MQTSLRIDDGLYREAKAEAARQGVTLTRFIEEGLRLRLAQKVPPPAEEISFATFNSGLPFSLSPEEIKALTVAGDEKLIPKP